ncbi:hypothetical protein IGB42_03997 [Andreprevotia sp. IGB-42]|uniref:YhfG family protein n=1 Tax=Andreprevotia sp. IGB-42 TaxID=2497473 RepID=UPI0013593965|nr:YhfG family protein [Andreprevotia sp. IGB-42]KAF0811540.1 hypothetical protein IGB42_03997 [Andreprevotia sp. IGB-42]
MSKASHAIKRAYVQQTRLANYNASLRLEGYAPVSLRVHDANELDSAKAKLIRKYALKSNRE